MACYFAATRRVYTSISLLISTNMNPRGKENGFGTLTANYKSRDEQRWMLVTRNELTMGE
jgi:hypothetical protein